MSHSTLTSVRTLLRATMLVTPIAVAVTGSISAAAVMTAAPAAAKTPGARYCFARACHRVMTLSETRAVVGKTVAAVTSFYDDCRRDRYNPCGLTSSGEVFRPGESNSAASPIYPDGTVVVVRNPANGESAIVRINNAGPYWGNRTLDLSRAAGVKLGLGKAGVAKVEVTVLSAPSVQEATYRKGRRYPSLPGHVGRFASMDDAQMFAAMTLDLPGMTVPGGAAVVVAHADTNAEVISPVGFGPLNGSSKRRLPADVVRLSATQSMRADGEAALGAVREVAALEPTSLAIEAVEINGVALPVPPAGAVTRVASDRAAIIGALKVGDFDRRGQSLLVSVGAPTAEQAGGDEVAALDPGTLAAVSAEDAAYHRTPQGAEPLRLERLPPLATRGERIWYRRAVATVSHVVDFAPADVTASEIRLARLAGLRAASFTASGDGVVAGYHRAAGAAPASTTRIASLVRSAGDERMRHITRAPARARSELDLAAA